MIDIYLPTQSNGHVPPLIKRIKEILAQIGLDGGVDSSMKKKAAAGTVEDDHKGVLKMNSTGRSVRERFGIHEENRKEGCSLIQKRT